MGLQQTTRDWKESISHKVAKSGQFVYDISEIMGSKDRQRRDRMAGRSVDVGKMAFPSFIKLFYLITKKSDSSNLMMGI